MRFMVLVKANEESEAAVLTREEMLALAGKVSSDLIEIILQRPKETGAVRP
jgi:hypothetical protein